MDIIKIPCQDYTKDRNTAQLNLTAPVKSSETGGLKEEISIATGTRVMLTLNIDVSDGLVNGACGTVENIIFVDHIPNIILVVFDSARTVLLVNTNRHTPMQCHSSVMKQHSLLEEVGAMSR